MAPALLDTNVLVYAAYRDAPLHGEAAMLVERGLSSKGLYCITPQNLVEFAAVVTRPRLVSPPLSGNEVARMTDLLYRSRRLRKIYPSRATVARTMRQGSVLGISGPRWYDLFLAMTMADNGVSAIITDNVKDFRFLPFIEAHAISQPE